MSIPSQFPQIIAAARGTALQALALQAGQSIEGKVIGPAPNGGTQVQIAGQSLNLVLPLAAKAGDILKFDVQGTGAQLRLAIQAASIKALSTPNAQTPTAQPAPQASVTLPLPSPGATLSTELRPGVTTTPQPQAAAPPTSQPAATQSGATLAAPQANTPAPQPGAPSAVGQTPASSASQGANTQVQTAPPAATANSPAPPLANAPSGTNAAPTAPLATAAPTPQPAVAGTATPPTAAPPGAPAGGAPQAAPTFSPALPQAPATPVVPNMALRTAAYPASPPAAAPVTAQPGTTTAAATPTAPTTGQTPPAQPATPQAALAQMVQTALPRQNSIASLTAALTAVAGKVALPEPVIRAAQLVLAGRVVLDGGKLDGAALQKAVLGSGIFQEAALGNATARLPTAQTDMKSALLGLRQSLASWLGQQGGLAAVAQPPPPLRGQVPRAKGPIPPPVDPAMGSETVGKHLLDRTDAALSRLRLHQHASLPDPTTRNADWSLDLPVVISGQQTLLQMQIHRDEHSASEEQSERGWQMRFAVNVPDMGEVGAQVTLRGRTTGVMLWAADAETSAALESEVAALRDTLASVGLQPGSVIVRHGAPQTNQPSSSGHFVDARS